MRRIAVFLLCFVFGGMNVFAQATRPRVVVTDNTQSNQSSLPNPNSNRKPPVIINGNVSNSSSSPNASTEDSGEVIQDDEVIKVETNLVTLPVTVLDRDGRFVSGLQQKDFQILEDGVPQKIEYFASLEQPFTVVMLIDVSNSTAFKINEIQDAAIAFVNQLRQNDRVMIISFAERVQVLSPPTNNRSQLYSAIRRLDFEGGTSLYEAIDYAVRTEVNRIEGRKAIVLFTDGVDTTSKRATYQSTLSEAEEVEAMIYPIRFDTYLDMNAGGSGGGNYPYPNRRRSGGGWGDILGAILTGGSVSIGNTGGGGSSRGTSSGDYEKGKRYLEDLARISGGRKFEANNIYNLEAAFSGVAEELRRQYSVGYYPENAGQRGQRKQISIRVSRPNAVVRARNSYIVGDHPATTAKQPVKTVPTIKNRLPF